MHVNNEIVDGNKYREWLTQFVTMKVFIVA